jgi:diguanylate cyclase (GGDEF)-like protein
MVATFFKRLLRTEITSEEDLRSYVFRTTAICVIVALAVDVANQLFFFVDWMEALRSWIVTTVLASAIAYPVSRSIGKSHFELYRAKAVVEALSQTDPLTGLPNRRALFDAAADPDTLVLVIVDIDRFKRVNDTHGHIAGDKVIQVTADILRLELGSLGQLGRLGGEEFALLAKDTPIDELMARLTAFRKRVSSTPILIDGGIVTVTISAGVATRKRGESFARLYADADRALYLAKAGGRNRITIAEPFGLTAESAEMGWRQTDAVPVERRRTGS